MDLIDRQVAIKNYQRVCRKVACNDCPFLIRVTETLTDCKLERFLHDLPSAQLEIVYCRDCKWYREGEYLAPTKFCFRLMDEKGRKVGYNFSSDDFCSHAERREDG